MTLLPNSNKSKHEDLFIEFSYFTRDYGTNALLHNLKILNDSSGYLENQSSQEEILTHELGLAFFRIWHKFYFTFFKQIELKCLILNTAKTRH